MTQKPKAISVLLYYHFATVDSPEQFVAEHKAFCTQHNLKGRIIISPQGINGTVAGAKEDTLAYERWLHAHAGFEKTWFKEQYLDRQPFPRMQIRARQELVTLRNESVDISQGGVHLEPEQVDALAQDPNTVFLDARNEIEWRIGKFKNAITPKIKTFRELPFVMKQLAPQLKDKKVIMYCTGGIRCETASALLKQEGVENVYQINGGIYNYCSQRPNSLFEGTCYVFDDRLQVGWNDKGEVVEHTQLATDALISECEFCGVKTARVINDERYLERVQRICCESCDAKLDISRMRTKLERQELMQQQSK